MMKITGSRKAHDLKKFLITSPPLGRILEIGVNMLHIILD